MGDVDKLRSFIDYGLRAKNTLMWQWCISIPVFLKIIKKIIQTPNVKKNYIKLQQNL